MSIHRRLCPDLAFFQMATGYPCEELAKTRGPRERAGHIAKISVSFVYIVKGIHGTSRNFLVPYHIKESDLEGFEILMKQS